MIRFCTLLFLTIFFSFNVYGQSAFCATVGGTFSDQGGKGLIQTSDGGYAITGRTRSLGAGSPVSADGYLAKFDAAGNLTWGRSGGGNNDEQFAAVIQTSDGGYATAGYTTSWGSGNEDVYVCKYNATGSLQWASAIGGTQEDIGMSLVETSTGDLLIVGYTDSYGAGGYDIYLIKLNSSGTLLSTKTIGNAGWNWGYSITKTNDGGYAIAGWSMGDVCVMKLDALENISWSKIIGGAGDDRGFHIIQTSDGGYAIAAGCSSFGAGSMDMYAVKLDAAGNLTWTRTIGGASSDWGSAIAQAADGSYLLAGYGVPGSSYDGVITKLDNSGNVIWIKQAGDIETDFISSIVYTTDGGFIAGGSTDSYGAGQEDIWLMKSDATGSNCCLNTITWNDGTGGIIANNVCTVGSGGVSSPGFGASPGGTLTTICTAMPPVASFTASNTNVCQGNCINFTDNSTNGPTSWSWSFPGATPSSSTLQNPNNICYATANTYTATLTVTNGNGSSTTSQTIRP